MEFSLGADHRRALIMRGVFALVLAIIVNFASDYALSTFVSVVCYVIGAWYVVLWMWRARFSTSVGPEGIEIRGYFNRTVPWSQIREIFVQDYERSRIPVAAGYSNRGRGSSGRGSKKVAAVKIVRTSGRRLELRAPLVTMATADSEFDAKVDAIREAWRIQQRLAFAARPEVR